MSPLAINGLVLALTAGLSLGSAALRPPSPDARNVGPCRSVAACTFSSELTPMSPSLSRTVTPSLSQSTLSLSKRAPHAPVVPYAGDTGPVAVPRTRPSDVLALTVSQPAYGLFRVAHRIRATDDPVVPPPVRQARTSYGGFPDF